MPWFHRSKSLGNTRNSNPHLPLPLTSLYPSLRPLPVEDRPVSLKRTEYSQCKLHPHFLSIVSDAKKKKDVRLFCSINIHFSVCLPLSLPSFSYSVHVGEHECICTCFWKSKVHLRPCHPSWVLSLSLVFEARSLTGWYSLIKLGYLAPELQLSDCVYPTSTGITNPYNHAWLFHMCVGTELSHQPSVFVS